MIEGSAPLPAETAFPHRGDETKRDTTDWYTLPASHYPSTSNRRLGLTLIPDAPRVSDRFGSTFVCKFPHRRIATQCHSDRRPIIRLHQLRSMSAATIRRSTLTMNYVSVIICGANPARCQRRFVNQKYLLNRGMTNLLL
jgi:hypothetical protein